MDTSKFKAEGGWIAFQQIDQFILSGGGVFDGQGKTVWGRNALVLHIATNFPSEVYVCVCVYIYILCNSFSLCA